MKINLPDLKALTIWQLVNLKDSTEYQLFNAGIDSISNPEVKSIVAEIERRG